MEVHYVDLWLVAAGAFLLGLLCLVVLFGALILDDGIWPALVATLGLLVCGAVVVTAHLEAQEGNEAVVVAIEKMGYEYRGSGEGGYQFATDDDGSRVLCTVGRLDWQTVSVLCE